MKKRDLNILKSKEVKEMQAELAKKRIELMKEDINFRSGKSSKLKEMRNLKRDIAQILTIIHERELQA